VPSDLLRGNWNPCRKAGSHSGEPDQSCPRHGCLGRPASRTPGLGNLARSFELFLALSLNHLGVTLLTDLHGIMRGKCRRPKRGHASSNNRLQDHFSLRWLRRTVIRRRAASRLTDLSERGKDFLFKNDADNILFRARMAAALLTLLLAVLVFLAAQEMFGTGAAFIALLLLVFDPNLLAHGAVVATNIGLSCFMFASIYAFYRYPCRCRRPGVWWLWDWPPGWH